VNSGYPIWLTAAKWLKTLGGGDPYGVATSRGFQGLALANHPGLGGFVPLRRNHRWLTTAQGTEARRAETENTGSVHDGPVAKPCAR
jgi:hypothetical protein